MAHTKRIASGLGKEHVWAVTPAPGTHSKRKSVTLASIIRDMLKYADTSREARKIINDGMILVDGKVRRDYKYGTGSMDIISIPKAGKNFRVMPGEKGTVLKEISDDEAKVKLCKILNKSIISGGKLQLNLHDGTSILVPGDSDKTYRTRDTVIVDLKDKKIVGSIEFNIGNTGLIVSGRHAGKTGKIAEIVKGTAARKSLTVIGEFRTLTDYVFVIGEGEPMISV